MSPTEAASDFERALKCHRAGRTAEAETLYRRVLAEDPDHHHALYSLSTLALGLGRNEEAAGLLARAVAIAPDNVTYHTNLGEVRRRLGEYREAIASLVRAISLKPDLAEAMYNLAVVFEENGEMGPAASYYERAADVKPDVYLFQRALAHALSRRGDLERAVGHYECALALNSKSLDVLGSLETTFSLLGRTEAAAAAKAALCLDSAAAGAGESCRRRRLATSGNATSKKGSLARALTRAREHEHAARTSSAMAAYRQALEEDPHHTPALRSLAGLALRSGDAHGAAELLTRAVACAPEDPNAYAELGEAYAQLGRHQDAAGALLQALSRKPDLAEAAYHLGLALAALGDQGASLGYLERAADLRPNVFVYQYALAGVLRDRGAFERALAHYHVALAIDPHSVDARVELGIALRQLGRLDSAVATYRRALTFDPRCALALGHLGAALADQNRIDEAIASCRAALAIDPDCSIAHFHLGNALVGAGFIDEAVECWRKTLALDPTHHVAHSNLVWMVSYSPRYDGKAILEEARAWSARHAEPLASNIRAHANDRAPDRRLRIGYVSPDFYEHSAAFFLVPLFRHHDRERFEIYAYSSTPKPDAVTERLMSHTDVWRDIARLGDVTASELVRQDQIDVLVDLALHTGRGRPRLFGCKPAPVQISWLGYPGTTGLSTMDYRMTDPFLDPPELANDVYTEASLVLPETFWCYDPLTTEPPVGPLPAKRNGHITFGCQNSFHKVNANVLDLWAQVLHAVEGSRLILHVTEPAQKRTLETLERAGVAPNRVELLPRRRRQAYLETYQQIDVGLDTVPFNGATTSLDAFWMGVPVVTLVGATVVGRAGKCLAMNLGLPEFVAHTADDFVRAAVDLTNDLGRLAELRAGLRARMEASPLMDAPRFARNLEAAYRRAWRAWCERGWSAER